MVVSLKREVQELKDTIFNKEDEIVQLKMSMKLTKINELENELRMYAAECQRMRVLCERAVKMSGEIDLKRLERRLANDRHRYEKDVSELKKEVEEWKESNGVTKKGLSEAYS